MAMVTVGLLVLLAVGVLVSTILQQLAVSSSSSDRSADLGFYQVAYLAGGRARVVEAAFAYLVWAGLVEVRPTTGMVALRAGPGANAELTPVEQALLATIPPEGGSAAAALVAAREAAGWVESELDGLVVPRRRRLIAALPALSVSLIAGAVATAVALLVSDGTGSGLLLVVPLVALVVILTSLRFNRPLLTSVGRRLLEETRVRFDPELVVAHRGITSMRIESGLYIVALYGREAMTGELKTLARVLGPR